MRPRTLLAAFATAATLTVAAQPLAAQQSNGNSANAPRLLATYDFGNAPRDVSFPRTVTVADSAGTIVARASISGDRASIPMTVTVLDADLVLQGETPNGWLTLILDRQNEGGKAALSSGWWTVGNAEGQLRGRNKN